VGVAVESVRRAIRQRGSIGRDFTPLLVPLTDIERIGPKAASPVFP